VTTTPAQADPELVAKKLAAAPDMKMPPPAIRDFGPDGRIINYKMQNLGFARKVRNRIGELIYNALITHIPSHAIRLGYLRLFGATIGRGSSILRGTTILDPEFLTIGEDTAIGFRCMLDARSGMWIGNNVVIASDVHIIGGGHDIDHPDFLPVERDPNVIEDYVWIASRATVVSAYLHRGAVVAACAFVVGEVDELTIVGGVPAKMIRKRDPDALGYSGKYRPLFC
jgi:acetyltransferase-like isoleucine patch superfamily enzyme